MRMIKTDSSTTSPDASGRWSTSSFGGSADTSPADLASLGRHLRRCDHDRDRFFALKCVADALDKFAAPRLVTTLVMVATICAVAWLVI